MANSVGTGMNYLVIDKEILGIKELTLLEKLVLAYTNQVEPYEGNGESCAIFLDVAESDVFRAKAHLSDLGLLGGTEDDE